MTTATASSTAALPVLLKDRWQSAWEPALNTWSPFTRLAPPRWCETTEEEKREGLKGSFAMIRFLDHAVVISLRQVAELHLEAFGHEILAHEIGHHVLAPADLRDNARLLLRIRAGIPTREQHAPMVANLYTDLLINDRLQRTGGLDMAGVYKVLRPKEDKTLTSVWMLYMRIYEILWGLQSGTLIDPIADRRIQGDAGLGAKVIRVYARDWLKGAARFAALLLPYLLEIPESRTLRIMLGPWGDTEDAGAGGEIPDGLAEIEDDENDAIHPSEDPLITGEANSSSDQPSPSEGAEQKGGHKNNYRAPDRYVELMKGLGVSVNEKALVIRYYRELALPHLIRFPRRQCPVATDPHPEGLDSWEPGDAIAEIDWTETLARGPHVIPGITTVRRLEGSSPGAQPERIPLDLYVGIDCSGSMGNPAMNLSYPIVAGTVLTLSALRAGARIMACLSGEEPGRFCETNGFIRNEREILTILTNYLGTGYSFGIRRLKTAFLDNPKPLPRPVHILVVSDSDMFHMLDSHKDGWQIAEEALRKAGGGGTFVLEIDPSSRAKQLDRMRNIGWEVHCVRTQEDMVAFARAFSRRHYETPRQDAMTHP